MEEKVQYQSEERIRDIHDQLSGTYFNKLEVAGYNYPAIGQIYLMFYLLFFGFTIEKNLNLQLNVVFISLSIAYSHFSLF